jgi:hypothetical protein
MKWYVVAASCLLAWSPHIACMQCNGAGVCAGIDLCRGVVCSALSQCHSVGICDKFTGNCSQPLKPVDTACDDANNATISDACQGSGVCVGIDL